MNWWHTILASAFGALLSALFIFAIIKWRLDFAFFNSDICEGKFDWTLCYASAQWNEESLLASLTGFYEFIITLLIGLLGIVAIFTFITIRSETKTWVKETVETNFQEYKNQADFQKTMREAIGEEFDDLKDEIDRLGDLIDG